MIEELAARIDSGEMTRREFAVSVGLRCYEQGEAQTSVNSFFMGVFITVVIVGLIWFFIKG